MVSVRACLYVCLWDIECLKEKTVLRCIKYFTNDSTWRAAYDTSTSIGFTLPLSSSEMGMEIM